jgi:hypothetical protein
MMKRQKHNPMIAPLNKLIFIWRARKMRFARPTWLVRTLHAVIHQIINFQICFGGLRGEKHAANPPYTVPTI